MCSESVSCSPAPVDELWSRFAGVGGAYRPYRGCSAFEGYVRETCGHDGALHQLLLEEVSLAASVV
jgi:hypothetical protein